MYEYIYASIQIKRVWQNVAKDISGEYTHYIHIDLWRIRIESVNCLFQHFRCSIKLCETKLHPANKHTILYITNDVFNWNNIQMMIIMFIRKFLICLLTRAISWNILILFVVIESKQWANVARLVATRSTAIVSLSLKLIIN